MKREVRLRPHLPLLLLEDMCNHDIADLAQFRAFCMERGFALIARGNRDKLGFSPSIAEKTEPGRKSVKAEAVGETHRRDAGEIAG